MEHAEKPKSYCPATDNIDRRKSAAIAIANTQPDEGAYWVKTANLARKVLRSKKAFQAGAGAEFVKFENPQHAPVFFLDGDEHAAKRAKTQRFLSPQAISSRHETVMRSVTDELINDFRKKGSAKIEDLSYHLAVDVIGDILGLTNSERFGRARRIEKTLKANHNKTHNPIKSLIFNLRRAANAGAFYFRDIRPAVEARKRNPQNDAISFFIEEGYSTKAILIECLTYGVAGMMTTREFIVMASWYLFEDEALRDAFLAGDNRQQLAILMEIVRLEPVAAMIHRKVEEPMEEVDGTQHPSGYTYGIDIRSANVDSNFVGECPFAVDPQRAKTQKDTGRFLSFSDGKHSCPGWLVALHETRIFLEQLFKVPGLKLVREPDISWNNQLKGYELRNAQITCEPLK